MNKSKTWYTQFIKNDAQGMLLCVVILIVIGCINVFSATFVEGVVDGRDMLGSVGKHMIFLIASVFIGWLVYHVDYRLWRNEKVNIVLCAFVIAGFLLVIFTGPVINGAKRWIVLPFLPISIQPSEFAKLVGIIWAASCLSYDLEKRKKITWNSVLQMSRYKIMCFPSKSLWAALVFAFFTILQPDMGTAVIILGFAGLLLFYSGLSWRAVGILSGIGLLLGTFLVLTSEYRLNRIRALYDPFSSAQDLGYQGVQSIIAVGSGGILGQGGASGASKYFYLPEAHTDFAFAVWAQETGFLGALVVVAAVVGFTYHSIRISLNGKDYFATLLGLGITSLISCQAVFNMLMVCGIAPVTGVPLPFISYGGSSLAMNCIAIALLTRIAKESDVEKSTARAEVPLPSLREETRSRFNLK